MMSSKIISAALGVAMLVPMSVNASTVNPGSDIADGGTYSVFDPHFYAEAFKRKDSAGVREFTFENTGATSQTLLLTTVTVNALATMFKGGVTFEWLGSGDSVTVSGKKKVFSGEFDALIAADSSETLRVSFGDPKKRPGFRDGGSAHFSIETAAAPSPIPLPAGGLLLLGALGGIAALRRRAKSV